MGNSDERCAGCEERRKIIQEAWKAARDGDNDAYQKMMQALLKSAVDDLLKSIKNRTALK